VLIDSENALDEQWLKDLGVDTSDDKLLKLNMAMIDDVAKTISEFMKEYKAMDEATRPKVLFVIDSLGMLLTPTDVNQFEAGEMKGDMGRKPKALTSLVRNCVNMFGSYNVGLVCTNHTYASQDMFDPDDKISGGQGFIYASSIVIAMRKLKLKTDADGNKTTTVNGIRAACKIMKTRYAKPFESVQVEIPYATGMSPYSGMVDLCEAKGILTKDGNRLKYVSADGTELKMYRKEWERNEEGCLDRVMSEFNDVPAAAVPMNVDEETGEIIEHE
jgi:RecA/RadA recombinase